MILVLVLYYILRDAGGGVCAPPPPPSFGISVNPIRTKGGRLGPPNMLIPTKIFDIPTTLEGALWMSAR